MVTTTTVTDPLGNLTWFRDFSKLPTSSFYIIFSATVSFVIGLKTEEIKDLIPEDIDIACHNGPLSVTVSGPAAAIEAFVEYLKKSGVFARCISSSNIPLHSRYVKEAGDKLRNYIKNVGTNEGRFKSKVTLFKKLVRKR